MKLPPSNVSDEDARLFRESIGSVRVIEVESLPPKQPGPAPEPRRLEIDEADALRESRYLLPTAIDTSDVMAYCRPGLSEKIFRQLKRGQFSIQDEIDLHHFRIVEAEEVLKRFLTDARVHARYCVLIVHGKGLHSEGPPVLKAMVDRVLRQRSDVVAFASAPLSQGGSGAVLVLLDSVRRSRSER